MIKYELITCYDPTDFNKEIAKAIFPLDIPSNRNTWIADIEVRHKNRLQLAGNCDDWVLAQCFTFDSTPIAFDPINKDESNSIYTY